MSTVRVSQAQNINLNQLFFAIAAMMLVIGVTMVMVVNMLVNAKVSALAVPLSYQTNPVTVAAPTQTNEAPAVGVCAVPPVTKATSANSAVGSTGVVATNTGYGSVFSMYPLGSYENSPSNTSTINTTTTDNYTYYDHSFNTTKTTTTSIHDNGNTDNRNSHNGGNTNVIVKNNGNTDNRNSGNNYSQTSNTSTTTSKTTNTTTIKNNGNDNSHNNGNQSSVSTTDSHDNNSNQGNTLNSQNGGNTTTNKTVNDDSINGSYNGIANGNELSL